MRLISSVIVKKGLKSRVFSHYLLINTLFFLKSVDKNHFSLYLGDQLPALTTHNE